jgi:hypothetical protein
MLALLRRDLGRRERAISILQRKHLDLEKGKIFVATFKSKAAKASCGIKAKGSPSGARAKAASATKNNVNIVTKKTTVRATTAVGKWEDMSEVSVADLWQHTVQLLAASLSVKERPSRTRAPARASPNLDL